MINITTPQQGFDLTVTIEPDQHSGAPWDNSPYSLTMEHSSRNSGMYQATGHWFDAGNLVAITSNWTDCPHDARDQIHAMHRATMSPRAYAALAARQDFERLRAWCNDDWNYVGIIVTASKAGINLGTVSLWGLESDDKSGYLIETAQDLAQEAIESAQAAISALTE